MLLHLSFEQLCYLFENEGYTDIASELKSTRFFLLYKKPPKKKMPFSRRTHDYYKTLKSCVDCGSFKGGARSQLREFIQRQDEILVSTLHSTKHDRQFAMERKSAAIVLLIQQYKNNEERKQILEQAIATETNDIDNSSLQIIYHSKMALTEAQSGNICQAEEHIVQTKILCQMFGPCFAVTSAFHDIQYTHKILYFMNPSKEMLEKIISDGDMGMQSLTDEKEDVQNLWRRIMLLYIVLSLLFIRADFIVTDMSKISKADKKRAKKILKEIKRCSDDIELRRQMIVYLCLASLYEQSDLSTAETYAGQSVEAAVKGGCFRDLERQNIEQYLRRIKRKKKCQKMRLVVKVFVYCVGIFLITGTFVSNECNFYIRLIMTVSLLTLLYISGFVPTFS